MPQPVQFKRLFERFRKTGANHYTAPPGKCSKFSVEDDVEKVKKSFQEHHKAHIRSAVNELNINYGKVCTILKQSLRFKAWTPHLTQKLNPVNMESRLTPCTFWLTFTAEHVERNLFSDEKWFVLNHAANKKQRILESSQTKLRDSLQEGPQSQNNGLGWELCSAQWDGHFESLVKKSSSRED